jgi:hypothetical protein
VITYHRLEYTNPEHQRAISHINTLYLIQETMRVQLASGRRVCDDKDKRHSGLTEVGRDGYVSIPIHGNGGPNRHNALKKLSKITGNALLVPVLVSDFSHIKY